MALVDHMENLRRAVASGQMKRETAVSHLVRLSGGGLTAAGAADILDDDRSPRDRYAASANQK